MNIFRKLFCKAPVIRYGVASYSPATDRITMSETPAPNRETAQAVVTDINAMMKSLVPGFRAWLINFDNGQEIL